MKRTAAALIVLLLAVAVPVAAEAEDPCEGARPGTTCTVAMECDHPEEPHDSPQEVDCTRADGSTKTCTVYPQDQGFTIWACPGDSTDDTPTATPGLFGLGGATAMTRTVTPGVVGWAGAVALASLGGIAFIGAAMVRPRIPRTAFLVPLAPLFSRISRSKALDHPRRQAIHDLVMAQPGIRLAAIGVALDLTNGELRHHVRVLEETGLIAATRRSGRVSLHPSGVPQVEPLEGPAAELLAVLQGPGDRRLEDARLTLGWTRSKTRYWTGRLVDLGLVQVTKDAQGHRRAGTTPTGSA